MKKPTEVQQRVLVKIGVLILWYFVASNINLVIWDMIMTDIPDSITPLSELSTIQFLGAGFAFFIISSMWLLTMYGVWFLTNDLFKEWEAYTIRKDRQKEIEGE